MLLCLLVVFIGGLWKAVEWVVLGVECMLMCMGSCTELGLYGMLDKLIRCGNFIAAGHGRYGCLLCKRLWSEQC